MGRTVEVDRRFAVMGAEARVRQLRAEIDEIWGMFPELRRGRRGLSGSAAQPPSRIRPKRMFSAKGRRAISDGMRKYWARRKATQAKAKSGKGARARS